MSAPVVPAHTMYRESLVWVRDCTGCTEYGRKCKKQIEVRDYLISRIEKEIPYVKVNGHREKRLPNNVNVCFRFIEGESLLIMLDQKGICASSGSACTSGSLDPSHVLAGNWTSS